MTFYEGWLYGTVMSRFQAGLNRFICGQVEPDIEVLEAGCGTGNLTVPLSKSVRRIVAVDTSTDMLAYARKRVRRAGVGNVDFVHGDITEALHNRGDQTFDLALMVLVLHEMPQPVRKSALRELARLARRILVVDFKVPQPSNMAGYRNRLFERLAGRIHHRAFRDYCQRGGTEPITTDIGLRCQELRDVDAKSLTLWDVGSG